MNRQLYVGGSRPEPAGLRPIVNRPYAVKPSGGLWTSTYLGPVAGSGWVRWSRDESFGNPDGMPWWLLTPDPAARVLVIDSLDDLWSAVRRYPGPKPERTTMAPTIDYEAAASEYDAIQLTDEGQWATRLTFTPAPTLYGWDCESTLWLRWRFTAVRRVARRMTA